MDKMKVKIEAPWTNGEQEFEGMLGFVEQALKQLKFFQKTNDSEHLKKDIQGYEEIVESRLEENAYNFMAEKGDARLKGEKYGSNLDVIAKMKKDNVWISR